MPHVQDMHADCWEGLSDTGREVTSPASEDVQAAIDALDGSKRALVTLGGPGESHLSVGGGPDEFYLYQTDDNLRFFVPVADPSAVGSATLCIGGQEGAYARRNLVGKDVALACALEFLNTGGRAVVCEWEDSRGGG